MGIDIYLKWQGQTEAEMFGQVTGFQSSGRAGYLREAYHGGPYPSHILVREAFEADDCEAEIPAAVMRERLTSVTEPARGVDGGDKAAQLIMQALLQVTAADPALSITGGHTGDSRTDPMTVEEAARMRIANVYPDTTPEETENYVQMYRDFVALAELKERETGHPCTVYASY